MLAVLIDLQLSDTWLYRKLFVDKHACVVVDCKCDSKDQYSDVSDSSDDFLSNPRIPLYLTFKNFISVINCIS